MEQLLSKLAAHIGLNTYEAYLDLEETSEGLKLWVIEKGSGGCTFPSMELLAIITAANTTNASGLLWDADFLKNLLEQKEKIKKDNPHFYKTVF